MNEKQPLIFIQRFACSLNSWKRVHAFTTETKHIINGMTESRQAVSMATPMALITYVVSKLPCGLSSQLPYGPSRRAISYSIMANEYTSPFCVPASGGFGSRSNSGAFQRSSKGFKKEDLTKLCKSFSARLIGYCLRVNIPERLDFSWNSHLSYAWCLTT